jgi:hypothetical protein
LFAAAPDLLAALENCLPWLAKADESGAFSECVNRDGGALAIEQARAALAKARGE